MWMLKLLEWNKTLSILWVGSGDETIPAGESEMILLLYCEAWWNVYNYRYKYLHMDMANLKNVPSIEITNKMTHGILCDTDTVNGVIFH